MMLIQITLLLIYVSTIAIHALQFDKRLIRGPIIMDMDIWKTSVDTVNRRHGFPSDNWITP